MLQLQDIAMIPVHEVTQKVWNACCCLFVNACRCGCVAPNALTRHCKLFKVWSCKICTLCEGSKCSVQVEQVWQLTRVSVEGDSNEQAQQGISNIVIVLIGISPLPCSGHATVAVVASAGSLQQPHSLHTSMLCSLDRSISQATCVLLSWCVHKQFHRGKWTDPPTDIHA